MFTTVFRAAARHAPQLRPVSLGASSSRQLSSTAVRNAEGDHGSSDHANIIKDLHAADNTYKDRAQAAASAASNSYYIKPFPRLFLEPGDFSMGRRVQNSKRIPRKPLKLGPPRAEAEYNDVYRQHNIDPLREAMNSRLMSDHVSELGKIPSRAETGLTWRSQRKLGKAIRRAKMMGVIPLHSQRSLRRDRAI